MTVRDRLATAINRNGELAVWWCAECNRFGARTDLHDHDVELGGLCNRCLRRDPGLHRNRFCLQCDDPRRGRLRPRLLAWAANRLRGVTCCIGCGKWVARARCHQDDDPEYSPVCAKCEVEWYDGYHMQGGCPACDALSQEDRELRAEWNAGKVRRYREARETVDRMFDADELPRVEVPAA